MVSHLAQCVKLSVYLSGFCGRSTQPRRGGKDGARRSSEEK